MTTTKKPAVRIKRTEAKLAPVKKTMTSCLSKPEPSTGENVASPDEVSMRCPMPAQSGELKVWALVYFFSQYEMRMLGLHPTRYHAQMARYAYLRAGEKYDGEPVDPRYARRHAVVPLQMACTIVDDGDGPVLKLAASLPTAEIKLDAEFFANHVSK